MALTINIYPTKPVINDPSFEVTTSLTEGASYNNLRVRAEVYMGGRTGKIATIEQPKGLDEWDFKRLLDRFVKMPNFALSGSEVLQKPTLGSELLTGWTGVGFTTFTTAGREITLADGDGADESQVYSNNLGVLREGDILVVGIEDDYINTGADPAYMFFGDLTNVLTTDRAAEYIGNAANKLTLIRVREDINNSYLGFANADGDIYLKTTASIKRISDFINDPCVYFQVKFTEYYENSSGVTTAGASSWSDTLLYIPAIMPDGQEFSTDYLLDFVLNPDKINRSVIRNVEIDDTLAPSVETIITVTAIDSVAETITFSTLPADMNQAITGAALGKEWLCVNMESFNVGEPPYQLSGNYALAVLLDQGGSEAAGYGYSLVSGYGVISSWNVGDQVVFYNPFSFLDYGSSNSPDLLKTDYPTISPTYLSANALFKRTTGEWVSIVSAPGTASGFNNIVTYATAPTIYGPWTAYDDYLILPTDINANYTGVSLRNGIFIEDQGLYVYLIICYDSIASKNHISIVTFDEDFNSISFHDKVIEEPDSSTGCIAGALFYNDGYYHILYQDRKSGDKNADEMDLKHSKSTNYTTGFSTGTIVHHASTDAGADADQRNKYYNAYIDGAVATPYKNETYIFIGGYSRHVESGTKANRMWGLAKFNFLTESLEFSEKGVVLPPFLCGPWPNTSWGESHTGSGMGVYKDGDKYYVSIAMTGTASNYAIIHAELEISKLFDNETGESIYKFLNKGVRNGEALFRNEGHEMRVLFATDETYINAWDSEGLFNGVENNPGYGYIIINNITMGSATSIWEFAIYASRNAVNNLMSEELNIQKISDKCFEDSRVLLYKGDLGPETMFFAGQSDKRHIVDRETYRNNNYEPRTISTQRRTVEKLRTGYQRQALRNLLKELISSELVVWMIDNSLSAGYREIAVTSDEVLNKVKDELIQSEIDIEYHE